MSSAVIGSRVRKACLPCIRAKAKCSASEHRPNECHRCVRLSKQCVFEVIAKKPGPGPKSKSRVRQLEQRVESLIDLIAAKNVDPTIKAPEAVPIQTVTPESSAPTDAAYASPADPIARYWAELSAFKAYDPVEVGLLDEQHAYRLVENFRTSLVLNFPFVLVDMDGPTLRHHEPFLFHAILTVTAFDTPKIQYLLSGELRRQVSRLIEHSRKSLGILQGLLVYAAWYHSFYHPANQQLATIVQLCVALVQDLGLSRNTKTKPGKWSVAECGLLSRPKGSLAEKRAYLGTFFLTVTFAQAWRKRTTLTYTRFMAQCCDAFDRSPVPTDALIRPLIKTSELLSRVHDHFSYDDIENADVRGELLLDMSATSFMAELKHIKDSVLLSPLLKDNTPLALLLLLLEIGINEICLHSALWSASPQQTTASRSLVRLKIIHRTMQAATSYMSTLVQAPQSLLFQMSLSSWCGWFYAFIVICKLVFLQENERLGYATLDGIAAQLENITEEIDNLASHNLTPNNAEDKVRPGDDMGPDNGSEEPGWNALVVAREYNVRQLLEDFADKLKFTLPEDCITWRRPKEERDSLHAIACIHRTMLHGFTKRIDRLASTIDISPSTDQSIATPTTSSHGPSTELWQSSQPATSGSSFQPSRLMALPFANFMNFDSLNFDGVEFPASTLPPQGGEDMLGDWMWDMAMDEFTMPSL